ncbi:MAG: HlyD family efflux transporter periplasmic adaptor subunit, partial [Verrucomicrobia bacterium]|nr:HlyD family efflux transporter periplasmic adaptor subunit [Verrucomicrobiota bacterium]
MNITKHIHLFSMRTRQTLAVMAALLMGGLTVPGAEEGHEGHAHAEGDSAPPRVTVTREQVARLGIKTAVAAKGTIHREVRVPGEVLVDADRLSHVVPRAPGVVREVVKTVGDHVAAGDVLAWIESGELAKAKLDFYAKEAEVSCCEIELPRAEAIFNNVSKLIALLKSGPDVGEEAIRELDGLEMGRYRGTLLVAEAKHHAARRVYERELELRKKDISSEQDLLAAETSLKQARAGFLGALDTARYETFIAFTEAINVRQVAVFDAVAAEQELRLKGADDSMVKALRDLVPKGPSLVPCACPDPECGAVKIPAVREALGGDERFAWYALRAPFAGAIIDKHIALGESIDASSEVFTVADLSSVWVDLAVSQAAIPLVGEGHAVTIRLPDGGAVEGKIDFVSPLVEASTRTALARVVVDNREGRARPGSFIEAV